MRRAAFILVLCVLAVGLTGCFRSIGDSLEPTAAGVVPVAAEYTLAPTFTPLEGPTEMPTEEPVIEPTEEVMTDLPSPIPSDTPVSPTDTLTPTPEVVSVDGQGGPTGPTPTDTAVFVAQAPSNTPQPPATDVPPPTQIVILTETPIPSDTPWPTETVDMQATIDAEVNTILTATANAWTDTPVPTQTLPPAVAFGPTSTFTSVPFMRPLPSPTYTPFMVAAAPQEGVPLAERPTETLPPADGQGGPIGTESPEAVAQQPTLSQNQATATALVYGATATAAAAQGTFLPPPGVTVPADQQPVQQPPGVIAITTTPLPGQGGDCNSHLVSPGETLTRIALQYNVTVNQIAQRNNIVNPDLIQAGTTLAIPCPLPATATPSPQPVPDGQGGQASGAGGTVSGNIYIIEPGDNLYRISLRFGVSMAALMTANGLTPATINVIYAGQQLIIPGGGTVATPGVTPGAVTPGAVTPGVIYITVTPFQ